MDNFCPKFTCPILIREPATKDGPFIKTNERATVMKKSILILNTENGVASLPLCNTRIRQLIRQPWRCEAAIFATGSEGAGTHAHSGHEQ